MSRILVVGLGNPGRAYSANRHNIGFLVLDELARRAARGAPCEFRQKFQGEVAQASLSNQACLLLRPLTFMNESGRSVGAAAQFFQVPVGDVVVVHDEIDLPFGTLRLKRGGGHAGHNGLRSIISHLGGADFVRVRVGVGRPVGARADNVSAFVLGDFSGEERSAVSGLVDRAADAVERVLAVGLEKAMNEIHTKPRTPATTGSAAPEGKGEGGRPSRPAPPSHGPCNNGLPNKERGE